jgi:glutathione S-transferase
LRPAGQRDAFGVDDAKARIKTALDMIEKDMAGKTWALGDSFSLADCSAAPALFYADVAMPFRAAYRNVTAYLDRLMARPSYARALKEAKPYFHMIPK